MKVSAGWLLQMMLVLPACTASDNGQPMPGRLNHGAEQSADIGPSLGKIDPRTQAEVGVDVDAEYTGTRRLSGPLPGADESLRVRNAEAKAYFEPGQGGESVLWIIEDGEGPFRLRINVPGQLNANGSWSGADADTRIDINEWGGLSGSGYLAPFRIDFTGDVSDSRFALRMELVAEKKGVVPKGTRLAYDYDLMRQQGTPASTHIPALNKPARPTAKAGRGERGDCKRVRWKLKNVTDFNGGLHMIRVPVCEDE